MDVCLNLALKPKVVNLRDMNTLPIKWEMSLSMNIKKQKLVIMFDDQMNLLVIKENK